MFDIGWTELLLIGIVALIVVGPKELPGMFRKMGQMTGKARGLAREFQRAMESAADEAGVKDVQRDLRKMTSRSSLGLDDVEASIGSGFKASDFSAPSPAKQSEAAKVTEAEALKSGAAAEPAPKPAKKPAQKSVPPKDPETVSQGRKAASAARVAGANAKLTPAKRPVATKAKAGKTASKSDPA